MMKHPQYPSKMSFLSDFHILKSNLRILSILNLMIIKYYSYPRELSANICQNWHMNLHAKWRISKLSISYIPGNTKPGGKIIHIFWMIWKILKWLTIAKFRYISYLQNPVIKLGHFQQPSTRAWCLIAKHLLLTFPA